MMTHKQIRDKYLNYFKKLNHNVIPPAPLVLTEDATTLFTSSGMQPLVPYLLGQTHPSGKRLVNIQPCYRAVDIDEVGDNRHTTFFEMMGNWSLGDYFKQEQIAAMWDFYQQVLSIPAEKLFVAVYQGGQGVDRDNQSVLI